MTGSHQLQVPDLPTAGDAGPWQARLAMLKTIVLFAGPALSIPLGDPLMSLVDTVCVGQFASTLELAALGPNTLIFQFSTYVVAALATACTWYSLQYSSVHEHGLIPLWLISLSSFSL